MLTKSKLSSIETLISQALIDMGISREEFITILKEKDRYEMMKESLRSENGELYKIMRFSNFGIISKQKIIKYFVPLKKNNLFWYNIKGKNY